MAEGWRLVLERCERKILLSWRLVELPNTVEVGVSAWLTASYGSSQQGNSEMAGSFGYGGAYFFSSTC